MFQIRVALAKEFIYCRDREIPGQKETYGITWTGIIGLGQLC